jgi:diguanylate cyclase (GGDEF)-like protein
MRVSGRWQVLETFRSPGLFWRSLWRDLPNRLSKAKLPEGAEPKLAWERATFLAYLLLVMSLVGINTVLVLAADFTIWHKHQLSFLPFGCVIATYILFVVRSRVWLTSDARHRVPAKFLREVIWIMWVLGGLYVILFLQMMHVAEAPQRSLIYGVVVGCMSTAVLLAPVSVAFSFWCPITIGGFVSLLSGDSPADPFTLVILFGYAVLTAFCIIYLNNKMTERAINAIRIEENAELIKLLLRDFEENASDWLWETDAKLVLQHVSARLVQVAGKPREALTGRFPQVLFGPLSKADQQSGSALAKLNRYIGERSPFRDLVVPVMIDGEERSWMLTGKPIVDKSGRFVGYHGVGSDVTMVRRSQEQIAFLARHDSLTRLPNRVLFNEMLHLGCARCEEDGLALLCLDLDDFKSVNDTMGHATGDGILIAVSERLRGCIRDGDIAARLGGDEFAIILKTKDIEEVAAVARRICERVSRPYHFDGRLVEIGVSIGVTLAPRDGMTPQLLLKNADLALYRAKADGRAIWRLYDVEMDERVQDRRSLQNDLRQALARGEFYLNFQPIIDFQTKRIVAAEALLRWYHPERGQLSPAEFVPMAEGAGLIAPIGAWVLRQACAIAATWPADVHVSVNLSPLQFRDEELINEVDAALAESGLPPSRLELEITETTVLETNNQTIEALLELHGRGIRIALDDFGTGYSSLSYLRRFPFNKIKIDRSFIRDLGQEKDDASIILAIIGLAKSMKMVVTAEGVETERQAAFLSASGCSQAQGFLFYRPLSAEAIFEAIAANQSSTKAAAPNVIRSAAE